MKKILGYCDRCWGLFHSHDEDCVLLDISQMISEEIENNPESQKFLSPIWYKVEKRLYANYENSRWLGRVLEPMNSIFKHHD